jgi:RimJ/RimL family protein N-acetyltransferase
VLFTYREDYSLKDGTNVQIRFKSPADRKAWRHFVALVPDDSGHAPGTQLDVADLLTDYAKFDDPYMIAQVNDEIVGAMFVVPPDLTMGYHREHAIEFHMDVLPGWRHKGVGTALLESLVSWAMAQRDIKRLEAVFLGWNEPVFAMLTKAGFEAEGRSRRSWMVRTADGAEEYDDLVMMGMWLEP